MAFIHISGDLENLSSRCIYFCNWIHFFSCFFCFFSVDLPGSKGRLFVLCFLICMHLFFSLPRAWSPFRNNAFHWKYMEVFTASFTAVYKLVWSRMLKSLLPPREKATIRPLGPQNIFLNSAFLKELENCFFEGKKILRSNKITHQNWGNLRRQIFREKDYPSIWY